MARPNFSVERSCAGIVAGIDEAGRGPWAGPVVAAAVILNPKKWPRGMNDSKKLPPERREALYHELCEKAQIAVGMASVGEIDRLNILEASMLAMQRALAGLSTIPHIALVDGNRAPKLPCPAKTIIGGDGICLSIAAAGIVAKVTRDRLMCALAQEFPGYGWEKNAGYGTRHHQNGLAQFGVTPHHRRSFAPIRLLLEAAA